MCHKSTHCLYVQVHVLVVTAQWRLLICPGYRFRPVVALVVYSLPLRFRVVLPWQKRSTHWVKLIQVFQYTCCPGVYSLIYAGTALVILHVQESSRACASTRRLHPTMSSPIPARLVRRKSSASVCDKLPARLKPGCPPRSREGTWSLQSRHKLPVYSSCPLPASLASSTVQLLSLYVRAAALLYRRSSSAPELSFLLQKMYYVFAFWSCRSQGRYWGPTRCYEGSSCMCNHSWGLKGFMFSSQEQTSEEVIVQLFNLRKRSLFRVPIGSRNQLICPV